MKKHPTNKLGKYPAETKTISRKKFPKKHKLENKLLEILAAWLSLIASNDDAKKKQLDKLTVRQIYELSPCAKTTCEIAAAAAATAAAGAAAATAAAAAAASAAKTSARRWHGGKKIRIFTKPWKTKKLQKHRKSR